LTANQWNFLADNDSIQLVQLFLPDCTMLAVLAGANVEFANMPGSSISKQLRIM